MCGSGSGRWGSRRPIAEGLQRFDLAEYTRRPDAVKPDAGCVATISNGKISAQIRYTETATRFGGRRPWMLCPRCSRRCRVLFLGFGRVACRRCSACVINRKPWIGSAARCTQWARSPNKSTPKRWISRRSRQACIGADTIAWPNASRIKTTFGRW
jgi:hypothetical protein